MANQPTQDATLSDLQQFLNPILTSSAQAVYVYAGDNRWFCNEAFAAALGYSSPEEWSNTHGSFPSLFVDERSQTTLITAYQAAMKSVVASTISVTWKKKTGGTVDSTVVLVPSPYQGQLFALHYITF